MQRGRDRHADRRQRRRQVDPDDDDLRQSARPQGHHHLSTGRDITRMPTHEIARLGSRSRPEGRRIFPRMTVLENLQMGAVDRRLRAFRRGSGAGLHAVPAPQGAPAAARRHLVRRRAADAGDRPRADEPAEAPAAGRAVARPGASDRQADLRRSSATSTRQDGMTVFLVEQNAYHALKLAHRGYVMVTGNITMSGTGKELLEDPRSGPPISKAGTTDAGHPLRRASVWLFILVTVLMGGWAAWMTGRACASRGDPLDRARAIWSSWPERCASSTTRSSRARCCRSTTTRRPHRRADHRRRSGSTIIAPVS